MPFHELHGLGLVVGKICAAFGEILCANGKLRDCYTGQGAIVWSVSFLKWLVCEDKTVYGSVQLRQRRSRT